MSLRRCPPRLGPAVRRWSTACVAAFLVSPVWAQDVAPSLDAGDEVQITVFGEPDFSGKYTVDSTGVLALPWAGRLTVKGLSLVQLEQDLIDRLKAGYLGDPKVNASIATYRPFYVMGDVKSPGKYPFADGTMMLQAVAVAGGFRSAESGDVRLAQDYVRAREDVDVGRVDLRGALALQARLRAERDGSATVAMPKELLAYGEAEARAALDGEIRQFDSRRQSLDGEIALLEKQKVSYLEEITALNGQVDAKTQQGKLLQEELADVTSLFNRGIERKPQMYLLQRTVSEAESDRLQIVSYLARARENVASTELTMANKRNDRAAEVLRLLQDTDQRVERLQTHQAAASKIAEKTEALLTAQGAAEGSAAEPAGRHVLRVSRKTPEGLKIFVADDDTLVLPGDLIDALPTRKPERPAGEPLQSSDATPDTGAMLR